jgi:hypothetical protein
MILTRENRSTGGKTCPSTTLSTTNPTWTDPGSNPGLRGGSDVFLVWRPFEERTWCFFLGVKGPAADATDAPQPWGFLCNPVMKMMMIIICCPFPSNGAPVEWNWYGKTEVLGEKPLPVPLCPPQIPHALTRDRTRASAVGVMYV